ncbi:hypothetical protein FF100_25480 [Methylobacterium terricola]|uniref:Uncharacterized protein n=1 Tax=Methylobacterium terricola TaxID=2583531 RepID=A0A5C4LCT3_9HYPH|nr:hypothetical protein [Methylobacterium terricola]TNC09571.1 hypothetical protein FF100_25480 [Methylobacterium terricola]
MIHFDTKGATAGQIAGTAAAYEARLRQAAMVLALAVGVPLVLAWFGLLGWGVLWLARSALAL